MSVSRTPVILALAALVACVPEQPELFPANNTEAPVLTARDAQFSKTTMNANTYVVSWSDGDRLSVFNRTTGGSVWSGNLEFTLDDAGAGRFVPAPGVVVPFDEGVNYDWSAVYPFTEGLKYGTLPQIPLSQTQNGKNNSEHLATYDILYGEAYGTRTPDIQMAHTGTLLKWTVYNGSEQPLTVNSISFNNGTDTYVLTVTGNAEISAGGRANFFMVARPFSFGAGDQLEVVVNTSAGKETQIKSFSAAKSFLAGRFNTAKLICNPSESPVRFQVAKNSNGKWRLYKNGEEFFINGVAANNFYDNVTQFGGNVIRTYSTSHIAEALAAAKATGAYVLIGLPVKRERDGFSFDNTSAIAAQKTSLLEIVSTYASNPHVLGWIIGNEVDSNYSDSRVWDVVGDLSDAIKAIDPYHLTTTALAGAKQSAVTQIKSQAPSLDFLCVNCYYPTVNNLQSHLSSYGWNKPWIISEFGPRGTWNLSSSSDPPETSWGACVEQTSTQKASIYKSIYSNCISANVNKGCIGSCVFVWGYQTSGAVQTWYGMFDYKGYSFAAVDEAQYAWTGSYPANRAPVITNRHALIVDDGLIADNSIYLVAGTSHTAAVTASSPSGVPLSYQWSIYSEGQSGSNGSGAGIEGLISDGTQASISFKAPSSPGNYRLIVFARDDINKKVAMASVPFCVPTGSMGSDPDSWNTGNINW
ncbi:MAG: hypothetical protein IKZ91_00890 [Bacteroidales bacterium]|nr:hypothetical protein [Bacteroidales bacterium]